MYFKARAAKCAIALFVLAAVFSGSSVANPVVYDATADFSTTNGNPNGAWSYGVTNSITSFAFNPFDQHGLHDWHPSFDYVLGAPMVGVNTGPPVNGVGTGQLSLHPGALGEYAVLRFTAPTTGVYNLTGEFFVGDIASENGSIFLNSSSTSPLFQFTPTNNNLFSSMLSLSAGDIVNFAVGGTFYYGNTPLTATFTLSDGVTVPEPGSLALLGLGLAGLGWSRRKKA